MALPTLAPVEAASNLSLMVFMLALWAWTFRKLRSQK